MKPVAVRRIERTDPVTINRLGTAGDAAAREPPGCTGLRERRTP